MAFAELAESVRRRAVSSREFVLMSLERIERHDGPLNSVVWIREAAVEEAQVLDERIAGGEVAGPLCGLPLLVKDNEDLAGATTTFGSRLRADDPPRVRVRELYGQRRLRHDQERSEGQAESADHYGTRIESTCRLFVAIVARNCDGSVTREVDSRLAIGRMLGSPGHRSSSGKKGKRQWLNLGSRFVNSDGGCILSVNPRTSTHIWFKALTVPRLLTLVSGSPISAVLSRA